MANKDLVKLTLTNDISYLPIGQMVVREMAAKIGFSGEALYQIELGFEEAAVNVI